MRNIFAVIVCTAAITIMPVAFAQNIAGDPGPNENIIGPTPDPADIRDVDARQQNEPSCAIRPGDSACMICGYNDYRTVGIFGDGWQGVSQTCGDGWNSRIAPGHPNHPAPIDGAFAADPRMIAIPGMAIFNFIAGYRDSNNGVLAIQHWLEIVREDSDHYEPGLNTIIADQGTSGRFIDKPDAVWVPEDLASQGTITLSTQMESPELGTITRDYPTGKLYVAYAVVTGSGNFKVLYKVSDDLGATWKNQVYKLTEDQNRVSGISLTAIDDTVLATWRRQNDNNDVDSIMYSWLTHGGKQSTKAEVLADICAFDQGSNASPFLVSFRTNDFPWAANDGKNFYIFYSARDAAGESACATGRPKIVMNYANAGDQAWQSSPTVIDDDAPPGSFQFMPAAFGARGKVQVAWYDTRREGVLPPDILDLSADPQDPPFVGDYISADGNSVFRTVDVYSTRVSANEDGSLRPIPPPVRVSQFRIAAEVESGELGPVAIEGEALFPNKKMFAEGTLSFIGDYMGVAGEGFRVNDDGKTESNASAIVDPAIDKTDFLISWGDTRDVRGSVLGLDAPSPWSPPVPSVVDNYNSIDESAGADDEQEAMFAANDSPAGRSMTTEGLAGSDSSPAVCSPGAGAFDRSRDGNVYISRLRDRVQLKAITPRKPIRGLQRANVVALANPDDEPRSFLLEIDHQPLPCASPELCRASFRQQPSVPPFDSAPAPTVQEIVTVSPEATEFRTVFLTADSNDAQVTVNAYDLDCTLNPSCDIPVASIELGGTDEFKNPDYVSELCLLGADDPACDVARAEFHNPLLINPTLINPLLINPTLINPTLINPTLINPLLINYLLENPTLINPLLINTSLLNYNLENPLLINPTLINPLLINTNLENPLLINPTLINPLLINSTLDDGTLEPDLSWTDHNFYIQNTGNVTTAFNGDITMYIPEGVEVDTQMIAWAPVVNTTTLDCERRFQIEEVVYGTVNNPDQVLDVATIEHPFAGDLRGLADAGNTLVFTMRVFGTEEEREQVEVSGFTASAQAANCTQDVPAGNPDEWFCELALEDERERIRLDFDTTGPVFTNLTEGQTIPVPAFEANVPGGACLDPVGTGYVSATDDSSGPVSISCVNAQGDAICVAANGGGALPPGSTDLSLPVTNTLADPMPDGSPMSCTATDGLGNSTTVNVFFEVLDTSAPFFTGFPPAIVTVIADSASGTSSYNIYTDVTVQDVDFVDPDPQLACLANTQSSDTDPLPSGANLVTCRVTDASGFFSEQSYTVQVNDVTFPVITLAGDDPQIVEAGYPYVEAGASATDNVGVSGEVVIDASAVDTSATGDYLVSYTATDAAGNSTTAMRTVTVVDTTPPDFTDIPIDITISANDDGTATVGFSTPGAIDNAGVPTISCAPPSGSVFTVGMTIVTCTATDGSGNSASVTFDVIVQDISAPIIILSGDNPLALEVGVDYVEPGFTATDNVGLAGPVSVTGNVDNATPGTYTLNYSATDAAGNTTVVSRSVVLGDSVAPVLTGTPADIIAEAVSAAGNVVNYTLPTATDQSAGGATVSCAPASGSTFPIGSTTVTCIATDSSGNTSSDSFIVTVQDTAAPVVTVPAEDLFAETQGESGAIVDYAGQVSATDNIDSDPTLSCSPLSGSQFAPGETSVSCTATDFSGNSTTETFLVLVGYPGSNGIIPTKLRARAGSSNPLTWVWLDSFDNPIDTSGDTQIMRVVECNDPSNIILEMAGDPGSSGFRLKVDFWWEYNWQSDDGFGNPLPKGNYCAIVESDVTGQTMESPSIRLN